MESCLPENSACILLSFPQIWTFQIEVVWKEPTLSAHNDNLDSMEKFHAATAVAAAASSSIHSISIQGGGGGRVIFQLN